MLCRFNCCNIARKFGQRGPKFSARFAEDPPILPIARAVVGVTLGLNSLDHMLVNFWKLATNVFSTEPKQVDDHGTARMPCQVAPIAIRANITFKPGALPET